MTPTTKATHFDLTGETVISFAAAASRLPRFCAGRPVAPSTLTRWATRGVRGPGGRRVRLEAARCGGRWVTSVEALARFAAALTPAPDNESSAVSPRTPGQRRRASEVAERQLRDIGI